MELYIGGCAQGKLAYVSKIHEGQPLHILDGQELEGAANFNGEIFEGDRGRLVIYRFHLWVRSILKDGGNPEQIAAELVERFSDCIVICDELGNGIVPIEQEEREYRERTGRILIDLAKKAERVERVICGMGQRLK